MKTKFRIALDALKSTGGDVSAAKRMAAASHIKSRTWHKAIQAYTAIQPVPVISKPGALTTVFKLPQRSTLEVFGVPDND